MSKKEREDMPVAKKGEKIPAIWWKEKLRLDGHGVNAIRISKDFTLDEFESPDTSEVMVSATLLRLLQKLRDLLKQPIVITSGYRTPEHNKVVGGAKDSYHLRGMAADLIVHAQSPNPKDPNYPKLYDRRKLALQALRVGFRTVIIYTSPDKMKPHVHVDVREPGKGFIEV